MTVTSKAKIEEIAETLRTLQRQRRHLIKAQIAEWNQVRQFIRSALGWRRVEENDPLAKEKKRAMDAIADKAADTVEAGQKGEKSGDEFFDLLIAGAMSKLGPYNDRREAVETQMIKLADDLPGAEYMKRIKGCGSGKALAVIVAEAGDLSSYTGPRKLFKRLGLAPRECYPEGSKGGGKVFPKQRRAQIYSVVDDMVFRQQILGKAHKDNDTGMSQPKGPYGKIYCDYVATLMARGVEKNVHRMGLKKMTREIVKGLWLEWQKATGRPVLGEQVVVPMRAEAVKPVKAGSTKTTARKGTKRRKAA
jgi:hypothetical protein